VRAGTPGGDTRVAAEFVVLFGDYFTQTGGSIELYICFIEPDLGSEELAASDMKSREI
jgi:hypothetical protein